MIDVHSHILPGIDDGAKDIEMTQKLTEIYLDQDIDTIITTPHYYPAEMSYDEFCSNRQAALDSIKHIESIDFIKGSETLISNVLFNRYSLSELCIGNSNYLLIELPYSSHWDNTLYSNVEQIIEKFDVIPIIAHIERYQPIQNKYRLIQKFIDMDCLIQMNTSSIVNASTRRFALKLLKKGYINFIGTDTHNTSTRLPNYSEAVEIIKNKLSEDVWETLDQNAQILVKAAKKKF
ncbi:MAG: hypothetical protein Q4F95_04675 [Oscillospiraceae bacterium]|nr:hypothetical protein [Oscillospiraceae bacterium]